MLLGGDRYDVLDLKAQILNWIKSFTITRENFSDAATVAKSFKLLGDPSTEVAMHCLGFYLEATDRNFPGGDSAEILDELMEVGRSTLQLSGNQNLFSTTHYFIFAGWGDLVYFDMDKLQAGIRRIQIPNLQRQWKISFSLDPRYGCE